jgi:signal transduction histidine kinase
VALTTAVAPRLPAPARVLIGAVVLGGAVALGVAISWMLPMDEQHAFALLLIAGAVGLGAQMVLTFPHAGELEHLSLEESVWIAALVLAPRGVPTVGAIAGTVAWQYYRRTETHKIAFNAGQVAIAMLTAELTYGLIERRDPTDPVAWLMAALALAICSLINAGVVSLVISLAQGERFRDVLLGPWRITALSWLGNVSVGLLAAIAWDASPWGLALVAVPLGLLFVAYRGWMAQTVENELMEDIANAADEITRDGNLATRLPMGEAAPRLAALTVTLNRMLERLEGSFLRQHRFMRDAAEELRQPVAELRRSIRATGDDPALHAELDRISHIVDDMAALARADSPGFVRRKPTPLAPFLEEVAASAGPLLGARLTATLPPTGVEADIDPARMRQVLLSLLQNAAEHGGGSTRVVLRAVDEVDAWRFEVADEGGGVPAGHEDAVFEPFYRATPGSAGSGLGLALVRTVAGAHGGSAGILNRPGRGVTFWVRVPG